jgi:hypothetical protein
VQSLSRLMAICLQNGEERDRHTVILKRFEAAVRNTAGLP